MVGAQPDGGICWLTGHAGDSRAIAGDAGKGAAIGATVGTVRGGRQQRQANEASKQQAAQSAGAQVQQQANQAQAAYNQQMNKFKQGFSACMDARGYSVK